MSATNSLIFIWLTLVVSCLWSKLSLAGELGGVDGFVPYVPNVSTTVRVDANVLNPTRLNRQIPAINKFLLAGAGGVKFVRPPIYNINLAQQEYERLTKSGPTNEDYVKALQMFAALPSLTDETNKCSLWSKTLISNFNLATGNCAHSKSTDEIGPVERALKFYAHQHGEKCQQVYFDMWKSKVDALDNKVQLDKIDDVLQGYVDDSLGDYKEGNSRVLRDIMSSPWKMFEFGKTFSFKFPVLKERRVLWNAAQKEGRYEVGNWLNESINPVTNKLEANTEKIVYLYNKYLREPCDYVVRQFDEKLYELIRYDALWITGSNVVPNLKYQKHYAVYQVCLQQLKNEKHFFEAIVEQVSRKTEIPQKMLEQIFDQMPKEKLASMILNSH